MRWLLTTVHLLALVLAASIPLYFLRTDVLFTWHPTLMALAFLGFMTEGVLTAVLFRAKEGQERVAAIQKHLAWQLLAFTCLAGGFAAIYQNKVPACCACLCMPRMTVPIHGSLHCVKPQEACWSTNYTRLAPCRCCTASRTTPACTPGLAWRR